MDLGSPPPGGDQDRGPAITALFWVFCAVASIAVAMRFAGRRLIHATGADDWVMLFTLVLLFLWSAFMTYDVSPNVGGARHLYYLTPWQKTEAIKYNWALQQFVISGYAAGKVSIGLLILRILGPHSRWRRYTIYFILVMSVVLSVIDIVLSFAQCSPPRALWEPQLIESGEAKCLRPTIQSNFAFALGIWNVIVDTALATLPITLVWGLNMSTRKRVSCSVLLGLGLLAAICGAVKAHYLSALSARSDLTWETYNLFAWSGAELFVIIVCGSVAPMKPLWDRFVRKRRSSRGSRTGYKSKYSGLSGVSSDNIRKRPHDRAGDPYSYLEGGDLETNSESVSPGPRGPVAEEYPLESMKKNLNINTGQAVELPAGSGIAHHSPVDTHGNRIVKTTQVSITRDRL